MLSPLACSTAILLHSILTVFSKTLIEKEKLTPWDPNYCNDTKLQEAAGLTKTALGQFLGYNCDSSFYHCRWGMNGWRTYKKTCRKGLHYDTFGTQNCNYDFNVRGCEASKQCSDCFDDQFACCLSEECVDLGQRCDGRYDCLLEEDEQNCPTCAQHEFPCVNSEQCIPLEQRCNGVKDCSDGTDERNCDECGLGKYYCMNSKQCIDGDKRCNGQPDCGQSEDEAFCRVEKRKLYICRDQVNKIPMEKLCDGNSDCPDGSDERHCGTAFKGPAATSENNETAPVANDYGVEQYIYY